MILVTLFLVGFYVAHRFENSKLLIEREWVQSGFKELRKKRNSAAFAKWKQGPEVNHGSK